MEGSEGATMGMPGSSSVMAGAFEGSTRDWRRMIAGAGGGCDVVVAWDGSSDSSSADSAGSSAVASRWFRSTSGDRSGGGWTGGCKGVGASRVRAGPGCTCMSGVFGCEALVTEVS